MYSVMYMYISWKYFLLENVLSSFQDDPPAYVAEDGLQHVHFGELCKVSDNNWEFKWKVEWKV